MVLKILSQDKVPEMGRTHITAELVFEKETPSNKDVKAELAKMVKCDPDLIVVNKIDTKYGEPKAMVDAFQYDSKDSFDAVKRKLPKKQAEKAAAELKKQEDAKKKAEEESKAKAEAEKAAAEAAKEEPKEEAKEEAKEEKSE